MPANTRAIAGPTMAQAATNEVNVGPMVSAFRLLLPRESRGWWWRRQGKRANAGVSKNTSALGRLKLESIIRVSKAVPNAFFTLFIGQDNPIGIFTSIICHKVHFITFADLCSPRRKENSSGRGTGYSYSVVRVYVVARL